MGLRGWGPTISEVADVELRMPILWTLRADWARATWGAARVPRARLPMKARRSIRVDHVLRSQQEQPGARWPRQAGSLRQCGERRGEQPRASECEPAVCSTAKFDGVLDLRQQLDEVAIRISHVRERHAGCMLAALDESPSCRLDLLDCSVEA